MDIVSRIKIFMNYLGIANSQFADTCKIPRPTVSQILNGRNKKISDELISKIHEAYPQLSVLWLMFGEGEMVVAPNIKISEPQTEAELDIENGHSHVNETFTSGINFDSTNLESVSDNAGTFAQSPGPLKPQEFSTFRPDDGNEQTQNTISFNAGSPKEIVNILVFYSDGRFQQFVPMKD
ncbi:MAG: helix-turn-helix domain-containing protein [Pseudoflavonifractor sp.]|nr:helix-turn-helix domain-containing protein [Pseudoflavonifractor sp.]